MTKSEISNFDNVIDGRDVIARIEEIEEMETRDDDESAELASLKKLAEECENYAADWKYGETLIRGSYFSDYARELLEDCGDIPRNLPHYIEIDWEATARNIRVDYTEIDFGGVSYWIR